MDNRLKLILIYAVATSMIMISHHNLHAQPKSLGTTFSFNGFSVSYEHDIKGYDTFIELSLKSETSELFLYRTDTPGYSSSLTWNFPIRKWQTEEGDDMVFFAGSGIACGYTKDFKMKPGLFFGLKGKLGLECEFSRKVILSIFISPIIGSHIEVQRDFITMKYYRNGLIFGLVPEVGIKYAF